MEDALTGLVMAIENDPAMKDSGIAVAKVLLAAFDAKHGYSKLSHAQISATAQLSVGIVRASLRRLIEAGYFRAVPLTADEEIGDSRRKYAPG